MIKDINKYITIEDRKFCIAKYSAKDGLKTARLLIEKILPVLENFITPSQVAQFTKGETAELDIFQILNVDNVTKALNMISDNDLDILISRALNNCYEELPAGNTRILNENGTYGIPDIEYDYVITMRLVVESIIWSAEGFFGGSRLGSIMSEIKVSFLQDTKT